MCFFAHTKLLFKTGERQDDQIGALKGMPLTRIPHSVIQWFPKQREHTVIHAKKINFKLVLTKSLFFGECFIRYLIYYCGGRSVSLTKK